jgi:prephenate dehydrogenase
MLLGILGTGLIGASVGLAGRRAGHDTLGWDPDASACQTALDVGAIERSARSAETLAAEADVIVVAAPLPATLALLHAFPPAPRAVLVTDVASVKAPVVAAAAGLRNFVAGHPLAGSERSGPAAASADLFQGRVWAYVPPRERALEDRAREFIESLGARPLAIEAERHDAIVAFTSHLPQVASSALGAMLARSAQDPLAAALSGSGMRSMTRLAGSSWEMWEGILAANAAPVAQEVRALADILRSVADGLEAGDYAPAAECFSRGANGSAALRANDEVAGFVIPGTPNESEPR